jgi:hypothetical protein
MAEELLWTTVMNSHGHLHHENSGLLTYESANHYKDIILCSCITKYDPTKALIFCVECCDWYHLTCENLSNPPQNLDKYTCRTCKELISNGKL